MTIIRKEDLSEATHTLQGGERVRIAARRDQMSEEVISQRLRLPRQHGTTWFSNNSYSGAEEPYAGEFPG